MGKKIDIENIIASEVAVLANSDDSEFHHSFAQSACWKSMPKRSIDL
ncbi:hypothetical protein [Rhodoferax koreensis]|nr:hypothetical protein [Rhodoferax koreense]